MGITGNIIKNIRGKNEVVAAEVRVARHGSKL
jgi:hypothetical protein